MKKLAHSLALAGSLLAVAACDGAPSGGPRPAPKAKAAPAAAAPAPSATPAGPTYTYVYNPVGKRDPFRPPENEIRRDVVAACEEPLCQWDLDQLKLVAVVTGDSNPLAMVVDPVGRGHVVRRNARIGRQGGRVTHILRNSLTVTEYVSGVDGKVIANPVSLAIADDSERSPAYDLLTGRNFGE